jgi:hypothetical protein
MRRYSQFAQLDSELRDLYTKIKLPKLPPKSLAFRQKTVIFLFHLLHASLSPLIDTSVLTCHCVDFLHSRSMENFQQAPAMVARRLTLLQCYLQELLAIQVVRQSSIFLVWIQPTNEVSARSSSRRISI